MKKVGIFGTSGFAREVGDLARDLGFQPIYIARSHDELDKFKKTGDVILEHNLDDSSVTSYAIGIGDNKIRRKVFESYSSRLEFINLIHPTATFGFLQTQALAASKGLIVCAGVRFTNNIQVGDFNIFNLNSTVGHDVVCESFVNISPGANISGNVHIEECCWIGAGAVINQGKPEVKLRIGANTIIGSGAVVVKDCDSHAVYAGVPAKRIK